MKIIFLDVDGVLNCRTTTSTCRGLIGIEEEKVKLLSKIVKETDAKIVLTSTWKLGWKIDPEKRNASAKYLDAYLQKFNLKILDKTYEKDLSQRGHGIIEWLKEHIEVTNWVVLDDEIFSDYRKLNICSYLVKSNFYKDGLNEKLVNKAIKILNKEREK